MRINFIEKKYFLYILMAVFVFMATTAMLLNKNFIENTENNSPTAFLTTRYPDNPVLKNGATFPVLSAQGVLAVDLDSGISLYDKNSDAALLPASTTKIVTALVAMDYYSLNDVLTVPRGITVDGQKMGLYVGEQMTVENLLYGLLVYSANDAAMTLAINYPGGYEAFVVAMNKKAIELSMMNSHFVNPTGLDENGQKSTARDLVRASEVAMRNSNFARMVGTKEILVKDISGKSKYNLKNINELLGNYPGVLGIKTGWTENARENLVTYVEREDQDGASHKVVIAILGSQDRFGETKELIDWIFENYIWKQVHLTIIN